METTKETITVATMNDFYEMATVMTSNNTGIVVTSTSSEPSLDKETLLVTVKTTNKVTLYPAELKGDKLTKVKDSEPIAEYVFESDISLTYKAIDLIKKGCYVAGQELKSRYESDFSKMPVETTVIDMTIEKPATVQKTKVQKAVKESLNTAKDNMIKALQKQGMDAKAIETMVNAVFPA